MTRAEVYQHEFVRSFPDQLQEGVLYVSVGFGNTAHRCMCGCGQEVYAPLSPGDWLMIYNGEAVSMDPSIDNWSFPCQSHYWLEWGRVNWAAGLSRQQIERGRALDRAKKAQRYDEQPLQEAPETKSRPTRSLGRRMLEWLTGR